MLSRLRSRRLDPLTDSAERPPTASERLVTRLSGEVEPGHSRRGFLTRATIAATAIAANPVSYVLTPGTAYASVCGSGTGCSSGWTAFCCTVNAGRNTCPPDSFVAGWWKADGSSFCGGAARYIIDCNATCPTKCTCYCASGTCDDRRVCCNQFRYGQCHQEIACYGPVVCRVATCTPPWVYDASCTTASATDNRTATHSAPCLDSAPPPPPPPAPTFFAGPAVGIQGDGRMEVFWRSGDGGLLHNWQVAPNAGWSGFYPFTGKAGGTPAVASNADGRLEVFYVSTSGDMVHDWQTSAGLGAGWSGPFVLPGGSWPTTAGCAADRNADGRLEVFVTGKDGQIHHAWQQVPNGGWSGFFALGATGIKGNPGLGVNQDGRLEVFAVAPDGSMVHNYQRRPNGDWSGFFSLGGKWPTATAPGIGRNADGRLEIFVVGPDNQLWHNWQVRPNGSWSGFFSLGGSWKGTPAVGRNADGRLEVFVEGRTDGRLWHNWQLVPNGTWYGWVTL